MKNLKRCLAMMLAICMFMSLLSVSSFAQESNDGIEESVSNFKCGFTYEHEHDDNDGNDCDLTKLVCGKHVHDDSCYTEGELTCGEEAKQDLVCEKHVHDEECYHECDDSCYEKIKSCTVVPCGNEEEGHSREACDHVHSEECYKTVKTCGYEDGEKICEFDYEHTHIELVENEEAEGESETPCYEYHTHSVEKGCYVCSIEPHTHVFDCLTDEAKAKVLAVETLIDEMPTLAEMQAARSDYAVGSEYETGEAAAAAYDEYIEDSFAARDAAQDAYDELPEELKSFVDPELLEKLTEKLDTKMLLPSKKPNVTTDDDGYDFQAIFPYVGWGRRAYEVSPHINEAGHPMTIVMVDSRKITGAWLPEEPYTFGKSEYEVLYCCEAIQAVEPDTHYKRINIEDADYFDAEAAAHIRAIVTNAYPYVSLEEMKANLKAQGFKYADELTRGDIISAVQFAIWNYSNEDLRPTDSAGEPLSIDKMTKYGESINLTNLSYASAFHDYSNELWSWWPNTRNGTFYDANAETRVNSLVDHLIGLKKDYGDEKAIVISSAKIESVEPVQEKDGVYRIAVKVTLNNSGSSDKDNIIISVSTGRETVEKEVVFGTTVYDLVVEATAADELVNVSVDGTQYLPENVYLYQPKTGKEASQVLIGVAEGATTVKATAEAQLDIPEEDPVTAALSLQKVNESMEPLTGAAFDLYRIAEDAEYNIGTYPVDETGTLVIEDLLPGKYEIKETVAPDGYALPEKAIAFEIDADGKLTVTENSFAKMSNGVLTVKNSLIPPPDDPPPPGGSSSDTSVTVVKVWNDDNDAAGIRPESITVVLLENGEEYDTVELSEANNWKHTWRQLSKKSSWSIEEVEVEGYTSSISVSGNRFTITNTPGLYDIPEEEPPLTDIPEEKPPLTDIPEEEPPLVEVPKTGDMSALWLTLSALSGSGLAGLNFVTKKRRDEEDTEE